MFLDVGPERLDMAERPDVAALEALVPVPTVVDQQVAPELRGAGAGRVADLAPHLLETFVPEIKRILTKYWEEEVILASDNTNFKRKKNII